LNIGENYTLLGIGNGNTVPIIVGKKNLKQYEQQVSHTLSLFPNNMTKKELQKSNRDYPKNIRTKAENDVLSLDDIFALGKEISIEVHVYGSDSVTGARKLFYKKYNRNDIIKGKFPSDKSKMNIEPYV
jgi:hypothetical protein